MKPVQKILLINTFGIGDVLFTTPVIANLKRAHPNVALYYLANRRTVVFLRQDPRLEKVFVYERDDFIKAQQESQFLFLKKWRQFFLELRREKFDCMIDFSMNRSFSFLAFLLGIRERIGFDYKSRGNFLNRKIPLKGYEGRHVVDYYCDLLRFLNIPPENKKLSLYLPAETQAWAKSWLQEKGFLSGKGPIAVVPGGGASWGRAAALKRWPATKYSQLVGKVVEKSGVPIILFGDKNEQALCQEIVEEVKNPRVTAAGETDLVQFAALLANCQFALVNDGGPLHMAVALGVRTISLFGPVDPIVYGPYMINQHIVVQKHLACQPCYRRFRMSDCRHQECLNGLSVDDVFRKVEAVL